VVVASRDGRPNGGLDLEPALEDLPVGEAEYSESESAEPSVPSPITFVIRCPFMVLAAIDFDHQACSDEEVDATDSVDADLALNRQHVAESQPDSGLRAALAYAIGGPESDSRRDEFGAKPGSLVQGAIDAEQRDLAILAAD
jgi:hypothetical protein